MQREIKFRVWDKVNKWFIGDGKGLGFIDLAEYESENLEEYEEEGESNNFYIFQQFTGLQDKNGKEIYEGDLLQYLGKDGDNGGKLGVISYDSDYACFICGNYVLQKSLCSTKLEIIGNIFKNP
jgi:uncharacterized phage protein (TIGR01671 family)